MNEKNVKTIAITICLFFSLLYIDGSKARGQRLEIELYNADQDRIVECGITHDPEYCHLLINGNCDEENID